MRSSLNSTSSRTPNKYEPDEDNNSQEGNANNFTLENEEIEENEAEEAVSEDFDYEDLFEDVRREEVLRDLNQLDENSLDQIEEKNEDLEEVLDRKAKREEKWEEKKKENEMKKLRQVNALEFFRKIKIQFLINFRNSILDAKQAELYCSQKIPALLSCVSFDLLKKIQLLKEMPPFQKRREDFIEILTRIFQTEEMQIKDEKKYTAIWALSIFMGIHFRKISFIDISEMDLETFYNLKYEEVKGKKKKIQKEIDILRNKLQRKATEEELSNHSYVSIDSYAFNPNSNISVVSNQENESQTRNIENLASRLEKVKLIKKNFEKSFCEIYCPLEDNWKLFNLEILEFQDEKETKNTILNGKAILGFYSTKILQFEKQYNNLATKRVFGNVEFRDQTDSYSDSFESVQKRKQRLGCKYFYKTVIKESHIFKTKCIFTDLEKHLIEKEEKLEYESAVKRFPKNTKEMRASEYFVVPSLVDKYTIIREGAKPLPNLEFHEEKVYYRNDLQKVSSRMGWIDLGRLVKDEEIPVKTTENKNKSTTKLYTFCQTEPFSLKLDENGDFILDEEYNSIYVPPQFDVPVGYTLIAENVGHLCKSNGYKSAKIVQGFDVSGSHIVPNNIGYLVESEKSEEIMKKYKERQEKARLKKEEKKMEVTLGLWKQLFKSIIITKQVHEGK